jgi:hypothetical protein
MPVLKKLATINKIPNSDIGEIDKHKEKELEDIIKWNYDLRNFLIYSNNHWKRRYPAFRQDYQGDKSIGYEISKKYVEIPQQYLKLPSLRLLNKAHIKQLPSKSFVIKEVLGHAGSRVLCMSYDSNTKTYMDVLHPKSKPIPKDNLFAYMHKKLNLDSAVIVEELLPCVLNSHAGPIIAPPPDFKVYTILGSPQLINVYFRLPEGRFEISYTPKWQQLGKLEDLYEDLKSLRYDDLPASTGFCLPEKKIRKKLLNTAEKLAKEHNAYFARYDFYVVGNRIILGEITPLCGGIRNNMLKRKMLEQLFPLPLRNAFNRVWSR